MASTLDRAQLLDFIRAGVRRYLKSATDTCVCMHVKFNCNLRSKYICDLASKKGPYVPKIKSFPPIYSINNHMEIMLYDFLMKISYGMEENTMATITN